MIARDYPDRPEMLARWKRADAYTRFSRARMNWLGEDHPLWFDEWLDGIGVENGIRYGPRGGGGRPSPGA
jgi:hypothetical protein